MRDGLTVRKQPGEMKFDGLPHLYQDSFFGIRQSDTAR
jgi:hypothetical protein